MYVAVEMPWKETHPDVRYWKERKIYIYNGPLLPRSLEPYRLPDFSFGRWHEDELNGSVLPHTPSKVRFTPREHQLKGAKSILSSYKQGWPGFLLADKTGLGKGLSASTLIPTPSGFKKIGDLRAGDLVLSPSGEPTKVIAKYLSTAKKFYKVTFSDGTTLNADSDHRWLTQALSNLKKGTSVKEGNKLEFSINEELTSYLKFTQSNHLGVTYLDCWGLSGLPEGSSILEQVFTKCNVYGYIGATGVFHPQEVLEELNRIKGDIVSRLGNKGNCRGSVKTTEEIKDTLLYEGQENHSIDNALPIAGRFQNLGVDPYVLGSSLCNFKELSENTGRDKPLTLRKLLGVGPNGKSLEFVKALFDRCLAGTIEQRMRLLAGVLDASGFVSLEGSSAGSVSFSHSNRQLFDMVRSLICSLGWTAVVQERETLGNFSEEENSCYNLAFRPNKQVFRLWKKAENLAPFLSINSSGDNLQRQIVNVEEIEKTEKYYCISVDSADHMYLVTDSYIPTHNTLTAVTGLSLVAASNGFNAENKAKLLIVCPKGAIPQWRNTLTAYPLALAHLRPMIINYEQLHKLLDPPASAKNVKKRSTKERQTARKGNPAIHWDYIIADEAHKLKNYPTSRQSASFSRVAELSKPYKKGKSPFVLMVTATPGSSPMNLALMSPWLSRLIDPSLKNSVTPDKWNEFLYTRNFAMKKSKAGVWSWATIPWYGKNSTDPVEKARHEETVEKVKKLQRADASRIGRALKHPRAPFIMRSPNEIAGWPEQQLVATPIELSPGQRKVYEGAWSRFRKWLRMTTSGSDPKGALVETLRYRQKTSLLKVESMIESVVDAVEAGQQVYISVQFIETLERYIELLGKKKIAVAEISGRVLGEDREAQRIAFQKGEFPVVISTIVDNISLHQGEDLADGTKATDATRITIIHDLRQNDLDAVQSLGRSHRDGVNSVAFLPYFEGTVDEKVVQSFANKNANLRSMMGESNPQEVEEIFRVAAERNE